MEKTKLLWYYKDRVGGFYSTRSRSTMHIPFFEGDLASLIQAAGYLGIFLIVFAESGLFIGFFLPGDSLLFTAGFLASQGYFDIFVLIAICLVAAIIGDNFGYAFGRKVGPTIFKREDSILFHKKNLMRAEQFYEVHGGKAIILARFMPVIRTFAPILAGVGRMSYKSFLFYNVIGAFLWAGGVTAIGYFLGALIPDVDKYLLPIIGVIVLSSLLPGIIHFIKDGTFKRIIDSLRKKRDGSSANTISGEER